MAVGDIGSSIIDQLSIGNPGSSISKGDVCHATGNFFAAVWWDASCTTLTIETFEVDTCGNIPCASQDTIDVPTTATTWSSLLKISDGVIALIYDDGNTSTQRVTLATYSVDACGNFGACDPIDTQIVNTVSGGAWQNLFKTQHSDTYCLLYAEGSSTLKASTLTINSAGTISTVLDTVTIFATVNRNDSWPFGVWTGVDDFYAFAYTFNNDNDGFIATWTIDSGASFGCSVTDTHEFETTSGEFIAMDSNDAGTLILIYESAGAADVKTILVDACGVMTDGTKIDVGGVAEHSIVRIDEGDKNVWFTVAGTTFKTYTIDGCDVPSQVDTLVQTLTEASMRAVPHPGTSGSGGIMVGVGWDNALTEFFAWSVGVTFRAPAPDLIDAGLIVPSLPSRPRPTRLFPPTTAFVYFPDIDAPPPDGNLIAKLKAAGVL